VYEDELYQCCTIIPYDDVLLFTVTGHPRLHSSWPPSGLPLGIAVESNCDGYSEHSLLISCLRCGFNLRWVNKCDLNPDLWAMTSVGHDTSFNQYSTSRALAGIGIPNFSFSHGPEDSSMWGGIPRCVFSPYQGVSVELFCESYWRFLGSNIATAISRANNGAGGVLRHIQVSSRNPHNVYAKLKETLPGGHLLPPVPVDVTKGETLPQAFENADAVVSLVGILQGSPAQFEQIQWKGAENVARAAVAVGAKLVHVSAIGADPHSKIPYARTKGLGEQAVLSHCPDATIIRPSLVFGPGDNLFNVRTIGTT